MRFKPTLLGVLVVLLCAGNLFAQQQVTIATGTPGTPDHHAGPIYRSSGTSSYYVCRYAYLYTQSELSAAGISPGTMISEISWYKTDGASLGASRINNFKVYVKTSTAAAYDQATEDWSNLVSGATLVYDDTTYLANGTGWVTFAFDAPFLYTGGSLEIMTDFDQTGGSGNGSTADLNWDWRTVTDRIYGSSSSSVSPATLSSTTNSIGSMDDRRPDIQFTVASSVTNDIGISQFLSPNGAICPGTAGVSVSASNFGVNQVDTFTVNWSINGNLQTPINAYSLLDTFGGSGATNDSIFLGNVNFQQGNTYTLVAWTTSPNNTTDSTTGNDSSTLVITPALSGTYTVGGSSPDYTTLNDALTDIIAAGMCGPILLDVRSGTYNEALDIPEITGMSATNTLTIQGNGTANTTINGQSSTTGATIALIGADYVTIKDMTVINPSTSADAWGIHLSSQADHNTIENCVIQVAIGTTLDIVGIVASSTFTSETSEGNNANYLTIKSCSISGGEKCISLEGDGNGSPSVGLQIIDCHLSQADDYGIYYDDQRDVLISGNTIENLVSTGADGIYSLGGYSTSIEKNKIDVPDYGIYLLDQNVNGLSFTRSQLVNNMVRSSADYGVYLNDVDSLFMHHNTVVGEPALYVNDHAYIDLRNNIFFSQTDQAVDFIDATPIAVMDHNLYHVVATGVDMFEWGTNSYPNLAAWQSAQSLDANSVSGDPVFVSTSDLHILGLLANDVGDATLGVTVDIDGDPRPFSPAIDVDMGADEVKILNNDAGVTSIEPACSGSDLNVRVINYGALDLQSFTVNWSIDGNLQTPVSISGASLTNQSDTLISLGAHGFSGNQTYDVKVWTSLPNGVNDPDKTNDSAVFNDMRTGLSGVYTVGGGTADFSTLNDAVDVLKRFGMCGPVELSMNSGTYQEQVIIDSILKIDANDRLRIYAASGVAGDVLITSASAASGDNWTLAVVGVDGVTIENLSIERSGTNNNGVAIYLEDADSVIIRGNMILADSINTSSNTTGSRSGIYSSDLGAEHNLLIENNVFSGNANGIWISGGVVEYSEGLIIRNNAISVGYTGVYTLNQVSPQFISNRVSRADQQVTTTFYGISINEITETPVIEKNEVIGYNSPGYGIRLRNTLANSGNKGRVENNMVQLNGNSTAYGISLESSSGNILFYHNTGYIKGGTSTGSRPFYSTLAEGDNELMNNIFIQNGGGYAFYITTSSTPDFSKVDNNMLYSTGTALAYWGSARNSLAEIQSASGMFDRSIVQQVPFVSASNLRLSSFDDVLVGAPLNVQDDIDGNARCSVPYAGAHEIAPSPKPLNVDFSVPDTLYAGGRGLFINSALRSERRIHEWFLDGLSVSTEVNLLQTFANIGSYEVKLISQGCFTKDSAVKTVSVIASFDVPVVDFTADRTKIFAGESINMIDLSTQAPTGWNWTVSPNNGVSIATQFSQDPLIFFSEPGVYEVCLVADNGFGTGTQVCKDKFVEVYPVATLCSDTGSDALVGKLYDDGGPFAAYGSNSDCKFVIAPCADKVTAHITFWDVTDNDDQLRIYDGTVEDPNHLLATFTANSTTPGGSAGITANSGSMLIVWNSDAATTAEGWAIEWESTSSSATQTAGFQVADTAFVDAPVFVNSMASGAKLNVMWDMDAPNQTDISKQGDQLFHIYSNPGNYIIQQIVAGCGGIDTIMKSIAVVAPTQAPSAAFEVNRRTLTLSDELILTDRSAEGPSNWRWEVTPSTGVDFNGTEFAPVATCTFSFLGTYDVKLVVSNSQGTDSILETSHIQVVDYCVPNSGLLSTGIGISKVEFAGIDQSSTTGDKAFTDYTRTDQEAQLGLGESYSLTLYRTTANQTMTRKAWIDWNQDGDFNDTLEEVAFESAANTLMYTTTVQVPITAQLGLTRMRVAGGLGNDPANSCGPALIGEFEDYRVNILGDITKPVVTLLGPVPMFVEAGRPFMEPGYVGTDNVDGNVTPMTITSGLVDTTTVGTYVIKYWAFDSYGNISDTVYREVNVTPDITAPVLSLLGTTPMTIEVNYPFTDPGYTAEDMPWMYDLQDSVVVTGTVNTTQLGTYTLTYMVMDYAGNSAMATRTVEVVDTTAPALSLQGSDTIFVEVNTRFVDPGTSSTDNYWSAFNVQVTGSVDETTLGTYLLTYTSTDGSGNVSESKSRVVIVRDATAPVIELVGVDQVSLSRWQTYSDLGYTLSDNYDDSADVTVEMVGDWVNSSEEGLYFVQYKATDVSGNVSFTAKRFIDVRGLNSIGSINSSALSLYPNPNNGRFVIESTQPLSAGTVIEVRDVLGKVVYRETMRTAASSRQLELTEVQPGVYTIQIGSGNTRQTLKVNIVR